MSYLIVGKFIETLGALLVGWVGMRACYIAVFIEGPVRLHTQAKDQLDVTIKELEEINELRHRLFGYWEAIFVGAGTLLIFAGCVVYLIGLISEFR